MSRAIRAGFFAAAALMLVHAAAYTFLCDDAFISFRYARNLAHGNGLVFNPGHERVEGFTNPLWVLVLAGFEVFGLGPETVANAVSLVLTAVLAWLVARASLRLLPEGAPRWLALLPLAWMALTRSIAVWGTSGLETRLFEVLTMAGVVGLIDAVERGAARPWPSLLLGLAAWTRPDGLMIGAVVLGTVCVALATARRPDRRTLAALTVPFAALVAAQFAMRLAYFGRWLPNTYYAKVDGKTWWDMGGRYLAAFALEYGVWLWVPAVALGVAAYVRARRGVVPLLLAAAVIPHALYIASIGGDHFEYRPLDLYFPLLFLLAMTGLANLRKGAALAYAAAIAAGLVLVPLAALRQFPGTYSAGFPGYAAAGRIDADEYLVPERDAVLGWPGIRWLAAAHRSETRALTRRFVAVRREEHVLFREGIEGEADRLAALVRSGDLPADVHVAIGCVGMIPYTSNLRTLDRFGLTDEDVARLPVGPVRVMAHEKVATFEMARDKGVDLWAVDPVHLLFREDDPTLLERVIQAHAGDGDAVLADVGEGWWLLARAPQGTPALARRLPRLTLVPLSDDDALARLGARVVEATRRDPARSARALEAVGRDAEALEAWRAAARAGDADAMMATARADAHDGRDAAALDTLDRLVAEHPYAAPGWYLRGVLLARGDRPAQAIDALDHAVELDPDDDDARYALTLALILAGKNDDAERELARLARRRPDLAEKIRASRQGP